MLKLHSFKAKNILKRTENKFIYFFPDFLKLANFSQTFEISENKRNFLLSYEIVLKHLDFLLFRF